MASIINDNMSSIMRNQMIFQFNCIFLEVENLWFKGDFQTRKFVAIGVLPNLNLIDFVPESFDTISSPVLLFTKNERTQIQ